MYEILKIALEKSVILDQGVSYFKADKVEAKLDETKSYGC